MTADLLSTGGQADDRAEIVADVCPRLPCAWSWRTVADMIESAQYGTSAKTNSDASGIPVLRMGNIQDGRIVTDSLKYLPSHHSEFPSLLLQNGDVLFNRTNSAELVGKCAVYRGNPLPSSFASYLIRLRLKRGFVPEFLSYFINSPFGRAWIASVVSQQVGQANVNGTKLKMLRVPMPHFNEQRRIVAEIEKQFTRLDAAFGSLKRLKTNFARYRSSILAAACEGRTGEIQLERPRYGVLPESWSLAELKDCCSVFVDSAHRTPLYSDFGPFALGPRDVVGGRLDFKHARHVNDSEFLIQAARRVPQAGDIVYSRELSFGWAAVIPEGVQVCLSQGMCLFRPKADVDVRYLLMVLNGPVGRKQALDAATGSAHPHVNLRDIKSFLIPLPPLEEQHAIVAEADSRLSMTEQLEHTVDVSFHRAKNLRQSILHRAFTGQL